MSDLLPCPCCGGLAILHKGAANSDDRVYKAQCHVCGMRSPTHTDKRMAVGAWNNRHAPKGWQLVPVEPTREMLESTGDKSAEAYHGLLGAWTLMLRRAPKP